MNQRQFQYNRASEFIRYSVTHIIVTSYRHWLASVALIFCGSKLSIVEA